MAYQSLYRRYRPQRFADVRGQDHLAHALRNAVVDGRVGHAYLFSGPRGTGKTTTARILAKVLNCEAVVDGEPCGTCASCLGIEQGTSFDVFELDAASNNGVEAIRNLIEKAQLGSPGRTKVYILDEVHMLSTAASNALLKTLEEPPDHVVFVLATTDPQKVLPTIKSRTQHFDLHLLPAADLEALVDAVVKDAGLDVSAEARDHVLRVGGGSARDTLSALDQVVAAGGVSEDLSALDELVEALCERDTGRALVAVDAAITSGRTPRVLGENLIGRLRDVFLAALRSDLSRLPETDRVRVADQAARLGAAGATRALEVVGEAFVGIQDAPDPRVVLEVALVRLTRPDADHSLAAIVERLERLERGLGPIGSAPPPAPARSDHPHVDAAPDVDPEAVTRSTVPAALQAPTPASSAPGAPGETSPALAAPDAGGRPGDAARQALAASRQSSGRPAPGRTTAARPAAKAPASRPAVNPPPARPPAGAPTAPARPTAPGTPPTAPGRPGAPPGSAPAADTGDLPSRDELTLAWGDTVLGTLSGRAKSRFAAGRFVTVADGAADFGLPNAMHAKRCEEARAEVEAALARHFGRPVPLRITVDGDAPPPPSMRVPPPPPDGPDDLDGSMDLSELRDATDVSSSSVDRIAEVFPGVEVVED
jgi:DNA polymerase-3 subunit gamma/tau